MEEIECAMTTVVGDNIDYIFDLIVTLVVANKYHTTLGRTYNPDAVMSKYEYGDYFAPEEAGLVVACQMFDILEEMIFQETIILTNKCKEKMQESN